ncbi:MAG: hypothetical protein ACO2PN_21590 [Pyrobaculum sp.]|jgi:hypothetical protein
MQKCIVTECYGNKCVGEYLRNAVGGEVRHRRNYGRELILRDIVKEIKPRCNRLVVVIDYETGDARILVEKNFRLTQICEKVWVGHGVNKLAGVVVVVFDPHIEAFAKWLGLNPDDELKHKDACNYFYSELKRDNDANSKFENCIQRIAAAVRRFLG